MPIIIEAKLTEIVRDPRCQMRVEMDDDAIEEYALDVDKLPPGKAMRCPEGLYLYDGWHTYEAHLKADRKSMRLQVVEGFVQDAIIAACASNLTHGLQRTDADKRKAITTLLGIGPWEDRSDRAIAEHCKVSHFLVGVVRKKLAEDKKRQEEATEFGHNGKSTGRATSSKPEPKKKIGRDNKARANKVKERCDRCKRIFAPPSEESVQGCTACMDLQTRPASRKSEPATIYIDDAGKVVPQRLIPVFAVVDDYKEIVKLMRAASLLEKKIEASPAAKKKFIGRKFAHEKMHTVLLRAYQRADLQRPSLVCLNCGGDGCKTCGEDGYLSAEEYAREKASM